MALEKLLQGLGLTEGESRAYEELVRAGEKITRYQLALKLGKEPSTIRVLVEGLRKKGLIRVYPDGRGKEYLLARDPSEALDDKERELQKLRAVVPRLHRIAKLHLPEVIPFNGEHMAVDSLLYMLENTSDRNLLAFFSWNDEHEPTKEVIDSVDTIFEIFHDYKLNVKGIAPDVPEVRINFINKTNLKYKWDVRLLPVETYGATVSCLILGPFTRYLERETGLCFVVQSEKLAKTRRSEFSMFWELGKNQEKGV